MQESLYHFGSEEMSPRHRVSRVAIDLLKRFEGLRRRAVQLPAGGWLIGHGHTLTAREGAEVSDADAEALLVYDLIAIAHLINETVYAPLTQNQFDALCSFAFNIGPDNFRQSAVLRRISEGQLLQAACAMEMWRKAQVGDQLIVVDALVRRRAAEKALFLTPADGGWIAAPSALLAPVLDACAVDLVPTQTPAPIIPVVDGEQLTLAREEDARSGDASDESQADEVGDASDASMGDSPVEVAAEAVTAQFQTLFLTPSSDGVELDPGSSPDVADSDIDLAIDPIEAAAPEPAAEEVQSTKDVVLADAELPPQDEATPVPSSADPFLMPDETPYAFRRPIEVRKRRPPTGLASVILLAATGLALFAGGLVWGLNATSSPLDGVVTPQLVGLLAGLAGALMFCVAAYLLLERLGRAAEAADDEED
jgi:lysozyme